MIQDSKLLYTIKFTTIAITLKMVSLSLSKKISKLKNNILYPPAE